jgi:lycopene cyclase domain-containing protein
MTTYLFLNLVFLATLIMFLPKKITRPTKKWWITLGVIVLLTAVFDPIIIALGIVDYDPSKILGILWFGAPIEDFFYAIYAVILVPLVWNRLGERRHG